MRIRIEKYIKYLLVIIISMEVACQSSVAENYSYMTTEYKTSEENFPNPERGFFVPVNPMGNNPVAPLKLSEMQEVRRQNMTLVRRYYLISAFRNKPLSKSFIKIVSSDLDTARKAGLKLIIRFGYNWEGGGYDASKDTILSHLEQLKPTLQANSDVITYMEAGFIGYWGQWISSSNNLVNNQTFALTNNSKAIFSKILSVLPPERMVVVPNPIQKKQMLNTTNPLSASEAFNGTAKARIGSHNDAFLMDANDGGYYTADNVERDKEFLSRDHLYVVQGGETGSDTGEALPYIGCSNALKDLARMRWSTLNSYNVSYGDGWGVIKKWEAEGCLPKIQRRLGYRFRLINSTIPKKVKAAGTFSMKFEIVNDGWASPYNPRGLEVILRNPKTGNEYYLPVNNDPRLWLPGSTKVVNIVGGIPATMPPGEYQVLLNLPDPTSRLYKRPEYSIRLANQNIWEASTGYNSLLRSVIVGANSGGDKYSGKQFFRSR